MLALVNKMVRAQKTTFRTALEFEIRQLANSIEIIAQQKASLAVVKTALPKNMADHVRHCVFSGELLLVYADNAGWASQIRFFSRDIVNKIAESGQQKINSLQVRLIQQAELPRRNKNLTLPSAENIDMLFKQLKKTDQGDILHQALYRLASTLEKKIQEDEKVKAQPKHTALQNTPTYRS